jgi:hypothetical protein
MREVFLKTPQTRMNTSFVMVGGTWIEHVTPAV